MVTVGGLVTPLLSTLASAGALPPAISSRASKPRAFANDPCEKPAGTVIFSKFNAANHWNVVLKQGVTWVSCRNSRTMVIQVIYMMNSEYFWCRYGFNYGVTSIHCNMTLTVTCERKARRRYTAVPEMHKQIIEQQRGQVQGWSGDRNAEEWFSVTSTT